MAAVTAADGLRLARKGYESAPQGGPTARNWCTGRWPMRVLARAPELAGRVVLDIGAGTGAVSRRLVAAGAHAVAVDASWPMLAQGRRRDRRPRRRHQWVAAGRRRGDGAAAAFCSTTSPILWSRWSRCAESSTGADHGGLSVLDRPPASGKSAIDGALATAGWEPPDWYRFFKSVEGQLGSAAGMRLAAPDRQP